MKIIYQQALMKQAKIKREARRSEAQAQLKKRNKARTRAYIHYPTVPTTTMPNVDLDPTVIQQKKHDAALLRMHELNVGGDVHFIINYECENVVYQTLLISEVTCLTCLELIMKNVTT